MKNRLLMATAMLAMFAGNAFAAGIADGSFDGRSLNDWQFSKTANKVLSAVSNTGIVDTALTPAGTISQLVSLVAGSYKLDFDSFGIGSGSTLKVSLGSLFESIIYRIDKINGHQTINFDVAASGSYMLVFSGKASGSALAVSGVDNVSISPVAVPGPEAGAGLGALAMAGTAFAVKRRRDRATKA